MNAQAYAAGTPQERLFVLPTKPYTIVDAINRMALATGSVRNAARGGDADYNGHHVRIWWNSIRRYWVADYTWGGSHVIARGELAICLRSAAAFYEGQGRGASVEVRTATEADAGLALAAGYIPAEEEDRSWRDWKFDLVNQALEMERHGFGPYTAHLIQATSREDYEARCQAGHRMAPIGRVVKDATS